MQQLIFFIRKYKYFLFFLFLEFIAVFLTINNYSFHKNKFISSANLITGGLYQKTTDLSNYFRLKNQNEELVHENTMLKNQLESLISNIDSTIDITVVDSIKYKQQYTYIKAKIVKNDYHKTFNFILIDRGENHGIEREMAVVNSKGIIGITDATSGSYARVQSILNKNSKINARLKNSFHFGSLQWNTKDYNIVQLVDIPKQAVFKIGDTVLTGGKSTIFPEGILIGKIIGTNLENTASTSIDIELFNDMSSLGPVYVIKNLHKTEIRTLENTINE